MRRRQEQSVHGVGHCEDEIKLQLVPHAKGVNLASLLEGQLILQDAGRRPKSGRASWRSHRYDIRNVTYSEPLLPQHNKVVVLARLRT